MAVPSTAGTCCWTQAEDKLADVLADCASVQTFLGEANKAAVLAGNLFIDTVGRVPEEYAGPAWQALFPQIIVGTPGDNAGGLIASRFATTSATTTGSLEIQINKLITAEYDPEEIRVYKNSVGAIIEELITKWDMDIQAIQLDSYGSNAEQQHSGMGVIYGASFTVSWGTQQESGE